MTARLTIVTSHRPRVLSKSFDRDGDGSVAPQGGGLLVEGTARVASIGSLSVLGDLLAGLGPNQALTYGVPRGGDGNILSRDLFTRRGSPAGATTRTRDRFEWPDGPGIMMIDHDPHGDPLGRDDLVALIRTAAPGLADAAMLWWPSASSHIHDRSTGEDLTGLRGQRLYLMVRDAADIPRAGAALIDRLWAAGHGRIVASAAGSALERCPADACVWQPERLDFAAGAVCADGLEQRRGEPVRIAGEVELVDTRVALPQDPEIDKTAAEARRQARHAAGTDLAAARMAFVEARVDTIAGASDDGDDARRSAVRATVLRAIDHAVLDAEFTLEMADDDGRFRTVSVGQILNDRHRYHGRITRDPLEPGYDGGRPTGKLFLLDARPTLFSFAHGGRSFRLIRSPQRVEIVTGRVADATEATLEVLRNDPAMFDFGGQVALAEGGRVLALDEHALGHYLGGLIQFWRGKKLADDTIRIMDVDPPVKLVRQVLSLGVRRGLKNLSAVVTAPTLRRDGSILATPGYDAQTGLLLDIREATIPEIPGSPTREQVSATLDRIMFPFRDFPLVDGHARGALLAALLTAAVRPSLPTTPAFAVDAPVQGSGKTLLASCIAALATGTPPEVWPHTAGRDDEEVRKRLFTALRDGTTAIVWDNVTGVLDSAAMAAAITASHLRDRVLGRSESLGIPNRALILLTGNNLTPAGDLARRLIPIRIDPATDVPFAREFDLDPLEYVLDHRTDMVLAALVLMRGRLTSGARRAAGRMASFEDWDDLIRQTVAWVGTEIAVGAYADPLELVLRAQGNDPEQESHFALLEALANLFPNGWFTAKDVSQRAQRGRDGYNATADEATLAEAIVDIIGDRAVASTKSIGKMLRFREDRVVFGQRLVSRPQRNVREFRVKTVKDPGLCRFGRFGRFESGDIESESDTSSASADAQSGAASGNELESSETNRPNRPNRHPADDPYDWRQW